MNRSVLVDYTGCAFGNLVCKGSYKDKDGGVVLKLACLNCNNNFLVALDILKGKEDIILKDVTHIKCSNCGLDSYLIKIPEKNETFHISGLEYRRLDRRYRNYRSKGKLKPGTSKIEFLYEMRE